MLTVTQLPHSLQCTLAVVKESVDSPVTALQRGVLHLDLSTLEMVPETTMMVPDDLVFHFRNLGEIDLVVRGTVTQTHYIYTFSVPCDGNSIVETITHACDRMIKHTVAEADVGCEASSTSTIAEADVGCEASSTSTIAEAARTIRHYEQRKRLAHSIIPRILAEEELPSMN
jgi:hypothetical protein